MPRVMLERPRDYKLDLVDLGCNPDVLGTVTWNSVTRSVDASGSVHLYNKGLTRLPFKFGKVGGNFECSYNRLTSLEGCPEKVGGHFWCTGNQLTSLRCCPKEVGGDFECSYNQLTSLEGCPKEVGWGFWCSANGLIDVSALRWCKIKDGMRFSGPKADQDRVMELFKAQEFKEEFICQE
jgi:hypothetical protein